MESTILEYLSWIQEFNLPIFGVGLVLTIAGWIWKKKRAKDNLRKPTPNRPPTPIQNIDQATRIFRNMQSTNQED